MWTRPSATRFVLLLLCGALACGDAGSSGDPDANASSSGGSGAGQNQGNGSVGGGSDGDGGATGSENADGGTTGGGGPGSTGSTGSSGATGSTGSTTGGGNLPADEAATRLFDIKAKFPRIDLTVSAASEASLRANPKTYTEATFTFTDDNGTVGPLTVGLRAKGMGSFADFDHKMSFKVDFNRLVANQTLFGLGKINLNNMNQDPSAVHEWVSNELFRAQQVPAPRVGYARVFVNGTQFGFYLLLETADDKVFLKRNFNGTRVLYEGSYLVEDGPHCDLIVGGEAMFELDKGVDDNRSLLTTLTHAIADAPANKVYADLATKLDWNEVLPMMATEMLIGHWDGYVRSANNYYVHFDDAAMARLIPWGLDQTLERTLTDDAEGTVYRRCMLDSACEKAYQDAYTTAQSTLRSFAMNRAGELRTLAGRLATELSSDPRTPHADANVTALTEKVISFLTCQGDPNADKDGDGARCTLDCNENDTSIPRFEGELCGDGIDQDCNGKIDDGC